MNAEQWQTSEDVQVKLGNKYTFDLFIYYSTMDLYYCTRKRVLLFNQHFHACAPPMIPTYL